MWLRDRSQKQWGKLCSTALLLITSAAFPQQAKAGFIGEYAVNLFTVTNVNGVGLVSSPDGGTSLWITGPNTGSGLDGYTDVTIVAPRSGLIQFQYTYSSLDSPGYDFSGYLLGTTFVPLADSNGQSANVLIPITLGQSFGFRVGTLDNTGEPGVLTITNFGAPLTSPVPEPGSMWLLLIAGTAAVFYRSRMNKEAKVEEVQSMSTRSIPLVLTLSAVSLSTVSLSVSPLLGQNYPATNVSGQLTLLHSVNPQQASSTLKRQFLSQTVTPTAETARTTPRLLPTRLNPNRFATTALANILVTTPAQKLTAIPGPIAIGFNGLTHADQRLANGGNQFSVEPPNASIAVGNGFVLEGVNNAIQIYNTAGTPLLLKVLSTNELFGVAPAIDRATGVNGVFPTDMRVFFDAGINRWFVLQRAQDYDTLGNLMNSSRIFLAVSRTADPTGIYNIYTMATTNAQNAGCPCVADYPQIGADQYGFYISVNEFNTTTQVFVDSAIWAINKAALATGVTAPTVSRFVIPFSAGYEFAIQPATTPPGANNFTANGGVEYFASTLSSNFSGSNLAIWALSNTSSLATATPNLKLTRSIVPTLTYSYPDAANQPAGYRPYGEGLTPSGPLPLIDSGDCRVQSLFYSAGRLHMTFSTKAIDENGKALVGAVYIMSSPTVRNGVVAASVLRQNVLVLSNNHILRPAIGVDSQGRGAIAATVVGPNWYPSAAFIPVDTFSVPSMIRIPAAGALPEDGFTGYSGGLNPAMARWGDYSTTAVAGDGSVWMVVQYIGALSRTAFANWGTFLMSTKP